MNKLFKEKLQSNIWKLYVFCFLDMFAVFLPYVIYYFQKLNLSLSEIAFLSGTMAITVFLFEIPSGYIADKFGRKNSLILSIFLQIVSLAFLFTNNYILFIISHLFLGLATSFLSGADSALLYDTLISLKRNNEYKKIDGKRHFFAEIAVIMSALLGGLIIKCGFEYTLIITIIGHAVCLFIVFSIHEPKIHKPIQDTPLKKELQILHDIFLRALKNKKLLGIFLYSFFVLGFSNTFFLMYQPFFKAINLPLSLYGVLFAFCSIFTAFAAWKVEEFESYFGMFKSLIIMSLFIALSFLGAGIFFTFIGLLFFMFRELVRGFIFPILTDYTNKIIKSQERATVLSIGSMFSRLGYAIIAFFFGFFSDKFGMQISYICSSIFLFLLTMIIAQYLRKRSRAKISNLY